MKTRALLFALPLLALAGCRDNMATVQIQDICFPTDDCSFENTCDAIFLGNAKLDVSFSALDRLALYIQVDNQTEDNTNTDIGKTNTNDAHVDQAVIEYEGIDLPRQVLAMAPFRVPAENSQLVRVDVIPDQMNAGPVLAAFAPTPEPRQMLALLQLRGYFDDGSRFETAEFPIGIDVCSGCIEFVCPAGTFTCPPASNGQLPISCPEP
jgi:hypothetical protein